MEETENEIRVEVIPSDAELELPEILIGIEFSFIVGLIRKATKEQSVPLRATSKQNMHNTAYAARVRSA